MTRSAMVLAALLVAVPATANLILSVVSAAPCTLDRATGATVDEAPALGDGFGARWNLTNDRIAFQQRDAAGYYRIFTVRPDASDRLALTAGNTDPPAKHQGAPYWHPSGRYVLFVAQKPEWHGPKLFGNPDYEALPGFGRHDDLWLIRADGSKAWQLTHEANTRDEGILLPVFSSDGHYVAWSSRRPGGKYALVRARFVELPEPHLEDPHDYRPGAGAYYEPGSFSSDGRSLFYAGDQDTHSFWSSQIYRFDFDTGSSERLTTGRAYNEHPVTVATPDGDRVVYMSTQGVDRAPHRWFLGTDWWVMRPDGSERRRLTVMNRHVPGNAQWNGGLQVATTIAMSSAGDFFFGDVSDSLTRQTANVHRVRLVCP